MERVRMCAGTHTHKALSCILQIFSEWRNRDWFFSIATFVNVNSICYKACHFGETYFPMTTSKGKIPI